MQSMSLREIVKRFVRRESLPVSKEGIYEDRFGDLEKLKNADMFEQLERVEELKAQIAMWNKRIEEKQKQALLDQKTAQMPHALKAPSPSPAGGEPLSQTPPPKGA